MREQAWREWFHLSTFDEDSDEVVDAGKRFDELVSSLENDQQGRTMDVLKYGSMYQNMDLLASTSVGGMPQQITNHSQGIVDQLVAKQVVNESKATFDVDDGDWEAHIKAEQLDKFVFGEFYRCKVYELHEQGLRDSAWAGDGWIKYGARNDKVYCERVFPIEIRMDTAACVSGPPRELYQIRYVSRSYAQFLYPQHALAIGALPQCEPPVTPYPGISDGDNIVRLQEGWHLPDDEHQKGAQEERDEDGNLINLGRRGVYMFACNGVVIRCREWKRSRFPFVRLPYSRDITGGYSIGIMQQLAPMQRELNKLKARKLKGLALYALPRVYKQAGTTLTPDFNNDVGQTYTWTGAKPEVDMSPCVSGELIAAEDKLENDMWQLAGISPLERGSQMPNRFDSRPGMREYVAESDEKHALPSLTWNRSFLEAARCIIDVARDITEEHGDYEAFGAAKDFVTKINFKDADLDDERFRIKLQNTNLLPTQPSGKRMIAMDLLKAGAFTHPMEMWQMMAGEHPDVDAILDRKTAGRKLVEKQMYMIVVKGKYFAPDIHQDAQYAKDTALDTVQQVYYRSNGGLDASGNPIGEVRKIVAMLDKYISACDDIMSKQAIAAQNKAMEAQAQQGAMNAGASPVPAGQPNAPVEPGPPGGLPGAPGAGPPGGGIAG